jgi:hypothetical protein
LKLELQAWAVDCKVTHSQLNHLLPILKKYHPDLPSTAKTLLKTPENMQCSNVSGGDYMYLGIETGLNRLFCNKVHLLSSSSTLELALNIDGLPLFSSSTYSLWPVLCYVMNVKPSEVFVVALYGGKSKPNNLDFIKDTVAEMNTLLSNGTCIHSNQYQCMLKMCVCDAPARSMVKCVKQCTGYFGCDNVSKKGCMMAE